MRFLSLAIFAVLAFVVGADKSDGMAFGLGIASALAAIASAPSLRLSTFLKLMAELFAVETVLFGAADL